MNHYFVHYQTAFSCLSMKLGNKRCEVSHQSCYNEILMIFVAETELSAPWKHKSCNLFSVCFQLFNGAWQHLLQQLIKKPQNT